MDLVVQSKNDILNFCLWHHDFYLQVYFFKIYIAQGELQAFGKSETYFSILFILLEMRGITR